jgi:HYR domain
MTRKPLALAVAAALLALVFGAGHALAAGGTYRITTGGDLDWFPESGAIDQTADDKIEATGTMVTTEQRSGSDGTVDYHIASGPGVVRARMAGSFTIPSNLAYPFNPSMQAVSTTELTVSGPDGFVNTTLNLHVDGIIKAPVCGARPTCGAESVNVSVGPFIRSAEFNTLGDTRVNDLGLAFDPVPGGYRVHGEVTSAPLGVRTNEPYPVTIAVNLGGRYAGTPTPTTLGGDFDDPAALYQVSFAPTGPVLNDIPAGYTVSGPNVVDNRWTDPFAPPSADVIVTNCADPALAGLTSVSGNLVFRNIPGCPEISMPKLKSVGGDLIVEHTGAPRVAFPGPVIVDGSVRIVDNDAATVVDIGAGSVGGDLDISGNDGATVINAGNGQIGGDATIVDNGDAVVDVGAGVSGDLTIETGGDPFSATTAGGATDVTILDATATMHVGLPKEAFAQPVSFTLSRTSDAPPEAGTAADGSPAQIDPLLGYRFAFGIPTLNADARLTFVVDLSQLDPAARADLLNAIAAGVGTIAVKGDAPDATFHAFARCVDPQTPSAGGCVSVTLLNASGVPAAPNENPAFARFEGVVGHFSTYAVATFAPRRDTTPPVVTVPADVTVDATSPAGAKVTYAASATDDRDPSPSLVCTRASGTVFAIGTTKVACTATDASGNHASASFDVRVRGASEQIVRLIDQTLAFLDQPALKPTLKAALQSTLDSILARNPRAGCLALNVYTAAVKGAPPRAFTSAERSELVADAGRIKAVIGC